MSIGPTVRRRRLGSQLRRLREAHSFKLEEAADKLGLAASTLSRIETGKAPTRTAYLATMFEMYGVDDPAQRAVLTEMAREGHRKGWWAVYDDVLPTGFDVYVGLEAEAAALRVFEDQVVHGLLQTEDYARTVMNSVRLRRQHPSRSAGPWNCGCKGSGAHPPRSGEAVVHPERAGDHQADWRPGGHARPARAAARSE